MHQSLICYLQRILKTAALFFVLTCSVSVCSVAKAADWQYTFRSGDTIWSVCAAYTDYKNCWRELSGYNGITELRNISIGEQLNIPIAWLKQSPVAATVLHASGQVLKGEVGSQSPLSAADNLTIGSRVATRNGSATLQFADGSLLVMAENSEIVLDAVSAFKQTRSMSIQVSLPKGGVKVSVPVRNPKTRFKVITPSAVAAVRGTSFRVNSINDNSTTRSEVLEGSIALSTDTDQSAVDAGYGALAVEGEAIADPVKLLSPPLWNLSCTDPGYVEWSALSKAEKYYLVLLEDDPNIEKTLATQTIEKTNFTFSGLEEKCYQVKVSAIDSLGFTGLESQRQMCYELQLDRPVIETAVWKNNKLVLGWNKINYAQQYQLDVSRDEIFSELVLSQTLSHFELKERLKKLPHSVYIRVRAESGEVTSEYSETVVVEHSSRKSWLYGLGAGILAFALL